MPEEISSSNQKYLTGAIASAFLLLINVLSLQKNNLYSWDLYPPDASSSILQNPEQKFDFIIVGAGAAGCTLANRLAQYRNWKILLIEAGDDPSVTTEVPAFYPTLKMTKENWHFVTQRDPNVCQGMIDKVCRISKGKALGGSTSTNNLHYLRGNPYDFVKWNAWGNGEWNPKVTYSTYVKLERHLGFQSSHALEDYGKEGEIRLNRLGNKHKVKELIRDAAENLQNLNLHEYYLGYFEVPGLVDDGKRFNLAKAFVSSIKNYDNFFLLKNCQVTKLLISDILNKKISGVECFLNKQHVKIKASKEVILSAGALNTAQIMLQSGLGPKNYLSEIKLPVLKDLKVGENLQEHIGVPIFVTFPENYTESKNQLDKLTDATYSYVIYRNGPLSNTNINDLVCFLNSGSDPYELPDLIVYHYMFEPNDFSNLQIYLEGIGYEQEIIKMLLAHNQNQTLLIFIPTLLKPYSRGTVLLNTTSPLNKPIITANFLSQTEDLVSLIFGFKFVSRLVNTSQFKSTGAKLVNLDLPNCRNFKTLTDPYIKCHIRNMAFPQGDVVGTAKMGTYDDPDAVVDEDLKVRDVTGLRVVDAAFMPEIVSANIQATMAMVADKVSEAVIRKYTNIYSAENQQCIHDKF